MHDVLGWRSANLARKHTFKVSNAHRRSVREKLDGKPLLNVLGNPGLKLLDELHLRSLRRQRDTQLLLSTRPAEVQNQFARSLVRDRAAAVFFYPCECKIDSGGNPRRRINIAVS